MEKKIPHSGLPSPADKQHVAQKSERYFQRLGVLTIVIGVFGFLTWAALAPLDKGVTASGTVMVNGNRKTVQSPGNGIVANVLVREGDIVQAGVPLVELSPTQARARYEQFRDKYLTALATHARLKAEQAGVSRPVFPDLLRDEAWRVQGESLMTLQQALLTARVQALTSEINSNRHNLAGLQYQIQSMERSLALKHKLNHSLRQQLNDMRALANENVLPRNRYRELERQQHDVQSQIEELSGQININQEKRQESEQRIKQIEAEYYKDVNSQLAKTRMEIDDFEKNMQIARYDLDNTHITAPVSGTVMALNVLTPGSVLSAGEALMDIVPRDTPLVIKAQVSATLIDKVYPQLTVNMMFIALNQNKTPVIPGYVTQVSPDRLEDQKSGESYYEIQVAVTDEGRQLLKNADIRPGMPVSVLVKTGSRSLLSYLFKPVLDRAQTAFTEE